MKLKAAFMLSTGRAGTGTFAHLLQQSKRFRAFHVPKPEMIEEAFEAQQAPASANEAVHKKIESIFALMKGYEDKIYAETNNKLYPFARELDNSFDARFFWVIRNPFEYVNSGISRKWYTGAGGVWDLYRERPLSGWPEQFTQEEKIAWQWCEINQTIESEFKRLRYARVYHFFELRDNVSNMLDLTNWLGADDLTQLDVEKINGLRINVGKYSAPRDPVTGDHVFGEKNDRKTESHYFDRSKVRNIIQSYWPSEHSEQYLA